MENTAPRDTSTIERLLRAEICVLVCIVVLALFPYIRDPSIDTKTLLLAWGAGLLTFICVLGCWKKGVALRTPRLFGGVLAALMSLLLLFGLASKFPSNSIEEMSRYAAICLIFFVAVQAYREPKHLDRLLIVVCSAVAVSVLYGIIQHFGYDLFPWNPNMKEALKEAPGTFGNGNIASHATVLCVIMAIYLAFARGRKYLSLIFIVLCVAHMDMTNQRGGIVAIAAAAALVASTLFFFKHIKRPNIAILTSFVSLALLGAIAIAGVMGLKMMTSGAPLPTGLPVLLRYHGYSGAARMILDHPIRGCGPGNYRYENPAYWTPFEQEHFALKHKMNYHAHNEILEYGTEAGLAGAALYFTFLLLGVYYGLRMGLTDPNPERRKTGLFFAAFFCVFLIDGFFGFNAHVPVSQMLLFLMAGAFEGIWGGLSKTVRVKTTGPRLASRLALILLALFALLFQSVSFASEMLFQRAQGAIYYKVFDQAETMLAEGESLAPWNWEFPSNRGEVALRLYKPKDAIQYFERAAKMNPYFPPVYTSIAHAYLMLGEIGSKDSPVEERMRLVDQAEQSARRALELCPMSAEGEDMLGRCACLRATLFAERRDDAQSEAQWREGATRLQKAIDDKCREPDRVYLMLARAQITLKDYSAAYGSFQHILSLNPNTPDFWPSFRRFAALAGRQKEFQNAVKSVAASSRAKGYEPAPDIAAAAELGSGDRDSIMNASSMLAREAANRLGRQDPAALKSGPDFAWVIDLLLEKASSVNLKSEDMALVQYCAGLAQLASTHVQEASDLFAKCWRDLPPKEQSSCVLTWSQILVNSNRPDAAVEILRDALNQGAANPNLQLSLARTLAKFGRNAEARVEYEFLLNRFSLGEKDRQTIQRELQAVISGTK
jgi:predicted Zn-dependent protease/O-antigen ligase